MEEVYGSYETAHIVYSKAVRMFPNSTVLLTDWAKLQIENNEIQKGKLLFEAACQKSGGRYVTTLNLDFVGNNFVFTDLVCSLVGVRSHIDSLLNVK
jgi:hypothetical protein